MSGEDLSLLWKIQINEKFTEIFSVNGIKILLSLTISFFGRIIHSLLKHNMIEHFTIIEKRILPKNKKLMMEQKTADILHFTLIANMKNEVERKATVIQGIEVNSIKVRKY